MICFATGKDCAVAAGEVVSSSPQIGGPAKALFNMST
eukprot:CAMPEP_0172823772 /NCGR_PEP_ID=MMETSP1075-20121228/17560_1 /TAXON_ID=2916 /ORGANISM="Ceratium fusus, Strain PA161109" /LENGTH=36 /DNA_ID= /DNA_START= /DNA_END= /DNA_ORIENTATION=